MVTRAARRWLAGAPQSSTGVQGAEASCRSPSGGARRSSRRGAAPLLLGQLMQRHALDHQAEVGVGHVSADAPHGWGELVHDLVQVPALASRSYELELHAQPLCAEWNVVRCYHLGREKETFGHHSGGRQALPFQISSPRECEARSAPLVAVVPGRGGMPTRGSWPTSSDAPAGRARRIAGSS